MLNDDLRQTTQKTTTTTIETTTNKCGRNLSYDIFSTNEEQDEIDGGEFFELTSNELSIMNDKASAIFSCDANNINTTITTDSTNLILDASNLNKVGVDKLRRTYEEKLLSQLTNEQKRYIIDYQTASALCFFESAVKRKCIMKNSQKPHFSQWHSYWLQLVGNVLIYYSSKLNLLPTSSSSVISSNTSNLNGNNCATLTNMPTTSVNSKNVNILTAASSSNSVNSDINEQYYYTQQLQLDRKLFHKDPSKMHPIANWMVVALFQDDCSLLSATNNHNNTSSSNSSNFSNNSRNSSNNSTHASSSSKTTCISVSKKKYDIQLNDLTNGKCNPN